VCVCLYKKMTSKKSQQSSMDGFLGIAPVKKEKKQHSLESFFGKKKAMTAVVEPVAQKENEKLLVAVEEVNKLAAEEENKLVGEAENKMPSKRKSPSNEIQRAVGAASKKRRNVIEDSDTEEG
jgi:hypothetical protein